MSKYLVKKIWDEIYGKQEEAYDYAGRLMKKSACGNQNSGYEPTIDHIRPISKGGKDKKDNMVICHRETNAEKNDAFPHWKANEKRFHARRIRGQANAYDVIVEKG